MTRRRGIAVLAALTLLPASGLATNSFEEQNRQLFRQLQEQRS